MPTVATRVGVVGSWYTIHVGRRRQAGGWRRIVRRTRSGIARRLLPSGFLAVDATPIGELRQLLGRLHPIATQHPLIRLGPGADGGYLVPDDLDGIEACFSPGVEHTSGFELDCANRGIQVFMADRTVGGPGEHHDAFHFVRQHLAATETSDTITIDGWVDESLGELSGDLMLQIDIERAEYEVLLNASDRLMRRSRIIVVEFHRLDQLFVRSFFDLGSSVFDKVLQTHACVHIHPNNCCGSVWRAGVEVPKVAEITFLRRDRIAEWHWAETFPHPLDIDNTPNETLPLSAALHH